MSYGIRYNAGHRWFDEHATAQDMQDCADGYRQSYNNPDVAEWEKPRLKANAAYCQSLAERKAAGR